MAESRPRLEGLSPLTLSFPPELLLVDFSGKRVASALCDGDSFIMVPPDEEEYRSVDVDWGGVQFHFM